LGQYQFQWIWLALVFLLRLWTEKYGWEKQERIVRSQFSQNLGSRCSVVAVAQAGHRD
jgi:hypothetical protein